ncbi:hypothetical protein Taro_043900 [Colocasia esculenta]|uniref:Helicase C-terminal domain-containing protein n=1 Tax=Colocasia esculenta TaxID=4460 RepID=A0A843X4Q7_COLES|nr:hypothetical protein [Colocasia esculenta]
MPNTIYLSSNRLRWATAAQQQWWSIHLYLFLEADNRSQQLGVLKRWEENRSILFLGYKQFSTIVCDAKDNITAACQEALLNVPSLLILDEGHTPRNENTNILSTLEKVVTPLKVVLSGTLFQSHVREVFNILNLVRRKFLKRESSRDAVRRILSRASIDFSRRYLKTEMEGTFCDIVEETLQNDDHSRRQASVIQDLREMTQGVLHYYKGDFLDELPGYIDFTVLLNLSSKQKKIIRELRNYEKFKGCAVGSAVYLHPCLKDCVDYAPGDRSARMKDQEIDDLLESKDLQDGVKTKFVLNISSMADTAGEKVLVFSQYILPLRFLERLILRIKGWQSGKETFMISGDTSTEQGEKAMEQFNQSSNAKVLFGSIKACEEGISLVGASRVIILDVHLNPSVSRQAIGRAFRPGQTKKVYTYRLVAADSPEEKDHHTCFRKELISKMWFEWSEHSGCRDFELESVDIQNSQDIFLDHLPSAEDIKSLYKRYNSFLKVMLERAKWILTVY